MEPISGIIKTAVGRPYSLETGEVEGVLFSSEDSGLSIYFFDEEISFVPAVNNTEDERQKEFSRILKKIERGIKNRMKQRRDELMQQFKYVSEMGKRDALRLALLRYGNTTLESIWSISYEKAVKNWQEGLTDSLNTFDKYDIEEVRRFIDKISFSGKNETEVADVFSSVNYTTTQEIASQFTNVFDRCVDEELTRIEVSESEL